MERMNKKAEELLFMLSKGNYEGVYVMGDFDDFELSDTFKEYTPEYKTLIKNEYIIHPSIPMPDENGEAEPDYSDSVVTPKGKAYLEEVKRAKQEKSAKVIAWVITTSIAIGALIISIIALIN